MLERWLNQTSYFRPRWRQVVRNPLIDYKASNVPIWFGSLGGSFSGEFTKSGASNYIRNGLNNQNKSRKTR